MKREQLEHAIRAAGGVLNIHDLVILGGQAIHAAELGLVPDPVLKDPVVRVAVPGDSGGAGADLLDASIGEASMFHVTFGYHPQGTREDDVPLPVGWRERLVPLESSATGGVSALCLEAHDLWVASAVQGGTRDLELCATLVRGGLAKADELEERVKAVAALDEKALSRLRSSVPQASMTVVLADDNDDHALLIERSLRRAAHTEINVLRARNGDEAIRLVDAEPPGLLLLDLNMPGRSGHEVLEFIKGEEDRLRKVPVAVLTSSDRDEDVARSYGLGGNHFITKPGNPAELEKRLGILLRNLEELGGIRRGAGGVEATGISAVDPEAVAMVKFLPWIAFILVLGGLAAYALFWL